MVKQALADARRVLAEHGIEEAHLEAEVLLREALHQSRAQLYADLERDLAVAEREDFGRLLKRRLRGEPTAYILGRREFYGRDFTVDPRVLIPRPESELLVDETVRLARDIHQPLIADIGTGSGAIAISIALEIPEASVRAIDISPDALAVARQNSLQYGMADRVRLGCGDLLGPLPETVDIIIANLPYVSQADLPSGSGRGTEPRLALDGGPDGLGRIRELCRQVPGKLRPGGRLLLEVGEGQAEAVGLMLAERFPAGQLRRIKDLSGIERVLAATRPA